MKEIIGNIWDFHKNGNWIVIPTNGIVKKNGEAVMGRGLALQAARKFPSLPRELGDNLNAGGNFVYWYHHLRLITFPTKHRWMDKSNPILIEKSLDDLVTFSEDNDKIYISRVGCGNGQLSWEQDIKYLFEKYLDERFIVIDDGRGNR